MTRQLPSKHWVLLPTLAALSVGPALIEANAQEAPGDRKALEEVVVTGSHIRQNPLDAPSPIMTIDEADIDRTGLSAIADTLQRLPGMGSALNTKFNSSGNFGSSQPGEGVGAGAAQVALRHLDSKRTLVLVNGQRWINAASATGLPGAPDLNTIPASIIERVEILQDGASAIYGSDAIGGVVNIITKKNFEGFQLDAQYGSYLEDGDGETVDISGTFGTSSDKTRIMISANYVDQQRVSSRDREQTRFLFGLDSCIPLCSSGTPQGRFVFNLPAATLAPGVPAGTNPALINHTLNDGVINTGPGGLPVVPADTNGDGVLDTQGDFHAFTTADRFNFQEFNLTLTPSERVNIFGEAEHDLTDNITLYLRAMYNNRKSTNQAAPEPIFIGPGAGTGGVLDTLSVDVTNPFNPFGCTISAAATPAAADCGAVFIGRRPLEAGPRIFNQDINTWYIGTGARGELTLAERNWYWDLNFTYAENRGDQVKQGGFIASRLIQALGPAANCTGAANGCVPLNLFGGQGDGSGSITQQMLGFVGFTQQDTAGQDLTNFTFNLSGSLMDLPAGQLGFAAGFEFREQSGFFQPDAFVVAGDTNGVPATPSRGGFDVTEFYTEVRVPLLADHNFADLLEITGAVRVTDYDFTDSEVTYKFGGLWRPVPDLAIRGSISTGLRAPSIGELFTSAEAVDELIDDPCDASRALTDAEAVAGCAAFGATGTSQPNEQIRITASGNPNLVPEESDNFTVGATYSPSMVESLGWVEDITFDINWYSIEVENAIRTRDANAQIIGCTRAAGRVALGDASAQADVNLLCAGISRTAGTLSSFASPLINISSLETSGLDFSVRYTSPDTRYGKFGISWAGSLLLEFDETLPINAAGDLLTFDRTGRVMAGTRELAFPEIRHNTTFDWSYKGWGASLTVRYIDEVEERCATNGTLAGVPQIVAPLCSGFDIGGPLFDPITETGASNTISDEVYVDLQANWNPSYFNKGITVTAGVNNLFDNDPPLCTSCGLNNFNATLHEVPGTFGYFRVSYRH